MTEADFAKAETDMRDMDADQLTFVVASLNAALVLRVAADTQDEEAQEVFVDTVAMIAEEAADTEEIARILNLAKAEKARREH